MDEQFRHDTMEAVHNPELTRAIDRATRRQDDARKGIMPELGDPWGMRALAGQCRDVALDRLDEKLVQLTDNVRANGGKVHWALDGDQARRIVLDVARKANCKLAIKTKSMMCEEIELNHFLQRNGLEVVETDLGEYIVQLADEPPSHIIGPACHKSAGQIAELFNEKLGVPYTEDAETLARSARGILREKFRQADMGITGANFAIAENGSIVIITNEGNGRFVTSRPRVLVTVMGLEKVVDRSDDVAVLMKVLARSATGQRLSVYANLTTGPKHSDDADGPEEFHLIIVDNGRSRVLASKYRTLLRCIRCGACLNACPVYRKLGGHAYRSIYPGPIGKLLTPLLESLADRQDLPQVSALCDACRDACSVRIELPEMLILMRQDLYDLGKLPTSQRIGFAAWAQVMTHPRLYHWAGRLAAMGLMIESQTGWVERTPPAGSPWTDVRDLPILAEKPFHQIWQETLKHAASPTLDEPTDLSLRAHDEAPHEQGSRRPYCEPATADPWRRTGETGALDAARDPECSQDVFIKRVRDALGAVKADALAPNRQRARLLSADEDLTAKFVQRLTELKVVVHHVDEAAAIDAVVKAVGEIGAKSAVMTDEGLIGASRLRDVLSTAGCALTVVDQNDGLTPSFEADVGITGAELAIAETGTVILTSGGSRRRLVGLAPPAHVILVPTDRIVADLLDWSDWYTSQPLHACQTMITGPSKTADIELTLVTGMHAPGVVHVVLIDQVPS